MGGERDWGMVATRLAALALLYGAAHLTLGEDVPVDEHGAGMPTLPAILRAFFSEAVWVAIGAVVGGAGVFAGACMNPRIGNVTHWMVLIAVPCGAVLSGVAATVCLLSGETKEDRVQTMRAINGVFGAVCFVYGMTGFERHPFRPPGPSLNEQLLRRRGGAEAEVFAVPIHEPHARKIFFAPDAMAPFRGRKNAGKMTYLAGLRSRGEPTQIIAAYGGVDMEVELIDFEEWGKRKGTKPDGKTTTNFLPYITHPNGNVMIETPIIHKHLAKLGGKFVVNQQQDELCAIANSAPIQLADPVFNLPGKGEGFLESVGTDYESWFEGSAAVLKDYAARLGDKPFFAGKKPGYAEAFVWHNLDNCFAIDHQGFSDAIGADDMAKLEAFYDRFAALDGVRDYLASRPTQWGLPGSIANPA